MKCPTCERQTDTIKSAIVRQSILVGCEVCLNTFTHSSPEVARFNREWQKREYRKDLVQPNQPREFIKAHGVERARENGYNDEQIRKYS